MSDGRSERHTAIAFGISALGGVTFVVAFIADASTQILGVTLALAFGGIAAALIMLGNRVLPQDESVEERADFDNESEQEEVAEIIEDPKSSISRRKLIGGAAGTAGAALGASLAIPVISLGPSTTPLRETPWKQGVTVVDEEGLPLTPDDVSVGEFVTGFPEGADKRELGSPIVMVRVPPEELELPAERQGWDVDGVLAFSKICPHAGCAINLYRHPLYEPTSSTAALVCPCHYSTFEVANGGKLIFGPAGRDLPQLPLASAAAGVLIAGGDFPEGIGPAWWGVREEPK